MEGKTEVKGRERRRSKQLLDEIQEMTRYLKLKAEAPDSSLSRTGFRRG
jgi:hypothetical protein